MNDRYLIDIFGELELGSFEDDRVEQDIEGLGLRIKNRLMGMVYAIRNNIKKIITITMGIFALIALAFSVIALITKKRKQVKIVM